MISRLWYCIALELTWAVFIAVNIVPLGLLVGAAFSVWERLVKTRKEGKR